MFHEAARKTYDCAICMYHDQALIPIKTLAFDDAVNVTLGLPFIRTSPDHGTAFDIAGTGKANPSSLIAALRLAARMAAAPDAHERDRRPSAAARGHSRARAVGPQIAWPEFPARPQPHRPDRARRRPARRCDHRRDRARPRRADARAAGARARATSSRSNATSAPCQRLRKSPRAIRDGWRSSAPMRRHFDPRPLLGADRAKIVANLPYNIATALLIDWLSIEPWPPWYDMMVLMFQREVAERIVAHENDEAYGRLGVLANWRAETKILFDISPAAFVPQPKVTSSVVRLLPRQAPEACDRRALEQVAAAAFGQRRKMLRQSLKSLAVDPARLAAAAAGRFDPARRDRSRRRLCCHGAGIDRYTQRKTT